MIQVDKTDSKKIDLDDDFRKKVSIMTVFSKYRIPRKALQGVHLGFLITLLENGHLSDNEIDTIICSLAYVHRAGFERANTEMYKFIERHLPSVFTKNTRGKV